MTTKSVTISLRSPWMSCALLPLLLLGGCFVNTSRPVVKGSGDYVQGALAYQEGDRERAMAALQSAIQENPDLIMARFLLGTIYREKGNYGSAAEQYQHVVELDPYVASNHYNLALMYHLLNRLHEAASSYLAALKLNPADMRSNMNLGLVYTALGRPELGLPYSLKAVEIDPKSAEAYTNLAVVLDTKGDYISAETAYRRALEFDSTSIETIINLAGCLISEKRYKEASSLYEQVFKSRDSSLLRQRYGYALLHDGRPADAIREFDLALKQNPKAFQALNGIGDARMAQYKLSAMLDEQKRAQAVDSWKKSLAVNPQQPKVEQLLKEYAQGTLFP